jgi:hypothetical protein
MEQTTVSGATLDRLAADVDRDRLGWSCVCGPERTRAAQDPDRLISSHRTSLGHVVYYRCDCGQPQVTLIRRWSHW